MKVDGDRNHRWEGCVGLLGSALIYLEYNGRGFRSVGHMSCSFRSIRKRTMFCRI